MKKNEIELEEIINLVNYLNTISVEDLITIFPCDDKIEKKIALAYEIHYSLNLPYGVINCMLMKVLKDKGGELPNVNYFKKVQEGWLKHRITNTANACLYVITKDYAKILEQNNIFKKVKYVDSVSINDWIKVLFAKKEITEEEINNFIIDCEKIHKSLNLPYGVINCIIRNVVRTQDKIPDVATVLEEAKKWIKLELINTQNAVIFISLLEGKTKKVKSVEEIKTEEVSFNVETEFWEKYKMVCKSFNIEPEEDIKQYIKKKIDENEELLIKETTNNE